MKVVRMSQVVDKVSELVRLRRWALSVLQSGSAAYPSVSEGSLKLFIGLERCAAPLAGVLGHDASLHIPGETMAALSAAALDDAKQVLRAERDAREIGAALSAQNSNAILLKGGVAAVLGAKPPLTLHDVDLLVRDEVREALEHILTARGFNPAPKDEAHHLCWYPPAGHLPVEIHWTTHSDGQPVDPQVWRRVATLDNAAGLNRLSWPDQVIHLVRHAIDQHVDRHVTIRDLLLAGWFISHLSPGEMDHVATEMTAMRDPARSRSFVHFARAVYSRVPMKDPFEGDAILHFAATVLLQQGSLWRGGPLPPWHYAATVAAGAMSLGELKTFAGRSPATAVDAFAAVQRYAPAVGALFTRGARVSHYLSGAVIGAPLLKHIRRKVRKQLGDQSHDSVFDAITPGGA